MGNSDQVDSSGKVTLNVAGVGFEQDDSLDNQELITTSSDGSQTQAQSQWTEIPDSLDFVSATLDVVNERLLGITFATKDNESALVIGAKD